MVGRGVKNDPPKFDKVKTLWEGQKIGKNLPLDLTKQLFLLSSVKTNGRFLWTSQKSWTLTLLSQPTNVGITMQHVLDWRRSNTWMSKILTFPWRNISLQGNRNPRCRGDIPLTNFDIVYVNPISIGGGEIMTTIAPQPLEFLGLPTALLCREWGMSPWSIRHWGLWMAQTPKEGWKRSFLHNRAKAF